MTDEAQTPGAESQAEESNGLISKVVETAKAMTEKAGEVVGNVTEKVSEVVGEVVEEVKEKVGEVVEEVKEKVGLAQDDDDRDNDDDDDDKGESSGVASTLAEAGSAAVAATSAAFGGEQAEDAPAEDDATAEQAADAPAEDGATAEQAADAPAATEDGAVFEPSAEAGAARRLADLEPGMELEGKVTSTALYGIFVDIGVGRDGLVHISEMADRRIESPSDLVQIGDTVRVRIKSVDPDARRISLTMRSPRVEQPGDGKRRSRGRRQEVNLEKLGTIQVGDLIEGTVNGIAPFGVFVDIGVGKDGLVHISELAEGRVERAEDAVTVGESYTFRVLEVDPEGQRISLSLRRAQEGYQERPRGGGGGGGRRREANLDGIEPGAILDGTVNGIAPFGAFIDLGVGRDGLVHISELSEGRIGKVEDVVQVGQKVQVRVLEVDPSSKRISLSLRLTPPAGPVSTSGSSRLDRDWSNPASREDRGPRGGGGPGGGNRGPRPGGGGGRNENRPPREPEVFTFGDTEEEVFEGENATIHDLLSKFGSEDTRRPGKKRLEKEDYEEERENRDQRARRDAIRRTLDTEE